MDQELRVEGRSGGINQWPAGERPRERLLELGVGENELQQGRRIEWEGGVPARRSSGSRWL